MQPPPSYLIDMLDWREIWLAKEVFNKLNGSKTVLGMPLTYRSAVSVPLITSEGIRLSKKMAPQTITPGRGPVWRAIDKAGSGAAPSVSRNVFDNRQDTVGSGIPR
ncbi:hypothetical protein TNCV_337411 [Trichonephila clavipes]|nr:hypothetical protein TNCV_337411 [Trichonephila clavipes]